MEMNYIELNKK